MLDGKGLRRGSGKGKGRCKVRRASSGHTSGAPGQGGTRTWVSSFCLGCSLEKRLQPCVTELNTYVSWDLEVVKEHQGKLVNSRTRMSGGWTERWAAMNHVSQKQLPCPSKHEIHNSCFVFTFQITCRIVPWLTIPGNTQRRKFCKAQTSLDTLTRYEIFTESTLLLCLTRVLSPESFGSPFWDEMPSCLNKPLRDTMHSLFLELWQKK